MSPFIRLFGSNICEICLNVKGNLSLVGVPFEFIDGLADDEQIQAFCDLHNVEKMPHVQIIDCNGNIVYEACGEDVDVSELVQKFSALTI